MTEVFLSIGSNCDRQTNIAAALRLLGDKFGELRLSPIYESAPVNGLGENYHNLCVGLVTDMDLTDFRRVLKDIEQQLNRRRETKDIVTIDIDILLFGNVVNCQQSSSLPHADITAHVHVLTPLKDIAPSNVHPLINKTIEQIFREMNHQRPLRRIT